MIGPTHQGRDRQVSISSRYSSAVKLKHHTRANDCENSKRKVTHTSVVKLQKQAKVTHTQTAQKIYTYCATQQQIYYQKHD